MPTVRYQRRAPEHSVLYGAVRDEWPAVRALAHQANAEGGLPAFIEQAAAQFLRCGILQYGFVRAVCDRCKQSIVVAFSCKQRGICNSCDGKRMTEVAAHWLDEVIAPVPIRQWVITFPFEVRYLLAWNAPLRSAVLGAFMRALQAHYKRQAIADCGRDPRYGAISVAQRFDGAVRLNVHYHILAADGAWVRTGTGLAFLPAPPLHQEDVEAVFADALRRIARQLKRLVPDRDDEPDDRLSQRQPALAALLRNAMLGNQSVGKDAGKPQRVEFGKARLDIKPHGRNCAQAHGYSLHANTRVGELARGDLEKLLRYVCRPAIAAHRLEQLDAQTIRISLKNEWSGGVTAVHVSPRDLLIRALAQVPLPRKPSIRYHGNFAPNAADRPLVVPDAAKVKAGCERAKVKTRRDDETVVRASTRMSWAECQKRAFLWDVLDCPCGGRRTVIAAVQDKREIERFLNHLQLWPDPGDITEIRGPPALLDPPDDAATDEWDAFDDPQPLDWVA